MKSIKGMTLKQQLSHMQVQRTPLSPMQGRMHCRTDCTTALLAAVVQPYLHPPRAVLQEQ